jgi:hypothetical protein
MAMSGVFVECKYVDLWSFDVSGCATGIEPSTGRVHRQEEQVNISFWSKFIKKDLLLC